VELQLGKIQETSVCKLDENRMILKLIDLCFHSNGMSTVMSIAGTNVYDKEQEQ